MAIGPAPKASQKETNVAEVRGSEWGDDYLR